MPASYVVAARYAGLALAAVVLAAIHVRRPTTVCLLRATTGIPCPFCGGTTALVRLGRADPVGAVRVSPLAVAMLTSLPLVGRFRRPAWWASPLVRRSAIVATLVVSEVWQLLRLGVIRL
jgi:hypothetical protein